MIDCLRRCDCLILVLGSWFLILGSWFLVLVLDLGLGSWSCFYLDLGLYLGLDLYLGPVLDS